MKDIDCIITILGVLAIFAFLGICMLWLIESFYNSLGILRLLFKSVTNIPVPAYKPPAPTSKYNVIHNNTKKRGQIMNEKVFLEWCKKEVAEYTNKHLDKSDNKKITSDDVFMVWCCKTLQNNKALLSTTLFDGMYYECTYNGDKQEMYIDAYKKWENFKVTP